MRCSFNDNYNWAVFMKLIQTKQVGSGKVFLLMPKAEFEAKQAKKEARETMLHLRKLRAMK